MIGWILFVFIMIISFMPVEWLRNLSKAHYL